MKSVLNLVLGGEGASSAPASSASQALLDLYKSGDGTYVPKTWLTDPYSILDSLGMGYKSYPSSLSYETLRQMTEKAVIVASVIQTRINQVAAFTQPQPNKYSIGFRIRHQDPNRKLTSGEQSFVRDLGGFIQRCGWDKSPRDNFNLFTRKLIRDSLSFDQACFEVVPTRSGKPHSFIAVPSDTIRIAIPRDKRGRPPVGEAAHREARYLQVIDGTVINEYTNDEMAFGIRNPRTDLRSQGYGYSEPEMLITTVTSHLWAEEWNRNIFKQGTTTKGILNLVGNIPPVQLENFKRQWMIQVAGVTNAWRTPIMNTEKMEWVNLQPTNNEMGYAQWLEYLIKVACAIYLIDPAEINFDMRAGMGVQPLFMTTNEAQQKVSKDRGLQPLLRFLFDLVNEKVFRRIDENFLIEAAGLDAKTEEQAIELRLKELGAYKTLNEARVADGLPPVEDGDIVLNPTYIGYKNQKAMEKMQAEGGGPPMPGQKTSSPGGSPQQPMADLGGLSRRPPPQNDELETAERQAGAHIERVAMDRYIKNERGKQGQEKPSGGRWPPHEDETTEDWEDTKHASDEPDLKGFDYIDIDL